MQDIFAYVMDKNCKLCGQNHFYMTKGHIVIIGKKEELEGISLADSKVELFDKKKTDIKKTDYIFNIYQGLEKGLRFKCNARKDFK